MKHLQGYTRFDLANLLGNRDDCVGIELGVAAGEFSAAMVCSGKFRLFWGVDMYSDTHDTEQYKEALLTVGIDKNYRLLRMTFDEAVSLFPDGYFDFIYLDGYAGSGLEGGKTLRKWAAKAKIGGIIAGDDYHEDFLLLQNIVDEFVDQNGYELMITDGMFDFSAYGHYPSWAVYKTEEATGETSKEFEKKGSHLYEKITKEKRRAKKVDLIMRGFFSRDKYMKLKAWNRERKRKHRVRKSRNI